MAEIDLTLLTNIESRLATYTASGQTLEDIKSYYVKRYETDFPNEFSSIPPVLLVEMFPTEGEIVSIPACMTRKRYPVRFQVLVEHIGDTRDTTAATLINLVEDVFYQQQLGISNLLIDFGGKSKAVEIPPAFGERVTGGASMTLIYGYTDTRAIP